MTKPRRTAPAKRPPREIEARRNRDQRRQQAELQERYARRPIYPEPEDGGSYRP